MSGTLNYGYISSLDTIDRDIKRIEEKADRALEIKDDVIRLDEKLKCFSKPKCNGYSKCETDELLEGKVNKKCGYDLISQEYLKQICNNKDNLTLLEQLIQELKEKGTSHFKDSEAHKELFDKKVDKQDGCRLICEEELQYVYGALNNRYTKEKLYTQEEVDALLARKADANKALTWSHIDLLNGFVEGIHASQPPVYAKDNFGMVYLRGSFSREVLPQAGEKLLQLPSGFRPSLLVPVSLIQHSGANNISWCTWAYINTDGYLMINQNGVPTNYHPNQIVPFYACFKAEK